MDHRVVIFVIRQSMAGHFCAAVCRLVGGVVVCPEERVEGGQAVGGDRGVCRVVFEGA
jgi:hypothetical protein